MNSFLIIAITEPDFIENEAHKIVRILQSGVDYVHIRKPGAELRDVKRLIEDIPYPLRCRLKLHGHFQLTDEFNLGGIQLNSRCPNPSPTARSVSRSCHSIEEVEKLWDRYEYVTLSPIYDSISKRGYLSKFNLDDIESKIVGKNVIAIGGVTPGSLNELTTRGFKGAAMLGCVWNNPDKFVEELSEFLKTKKLCCSI